MMQRHQFEKKGGGNASFELSSSSCDIIILPNRISVKTMFFKASSFLSKLLQRLSSTTFRQSQNYPSSSTVNSPPRNTFIVVRLLPCRCHAITIQMIFVSCFALLGSAQSRQHPEREYPEGQQNMEKQMKVKSFNPREGKLQQQKQTLFAKKLNEIQILSQVYNEKGTLHLAFMH